MLGIKKRNKLDMIFVTKVLYLLNYKKTFVKTLFSTI